jgi:3-hydroxy-3-methylglutaryl CoA synthase
MVGIVSYGAYIPKYRIDRKIIYKAMGWLNPGTYLPGEKAVANFDEDSITMSVAAGMDCLSGINPDSLDSMFFATTTSPYKERLGAQIIATAFNMRDDIRTADFANTAKAGTTAMLAAIDAVKAGAINSSIVCASDCRKTKPGGSQEELFGEGAGAILIGNKGLIANLLGSHSVSYDFVDHWKGEDDKFDRQWEDRFIRDVGYSKFITQTISGVLKKCNLEPKNIAKVCYPSLYAADHKNIAKKLGFTPEQLQDSMVANVGYTGAGNPLMLLVAALEDANPGDKIIVASFGTGSDALLFEVTDAINTIKGKKKGIKKHLGFRRDLNNYEKMISFRNILPVEKGIRGETMPFTALSELWRSRKTVLGLCGSKCKACGTVQFPIQRICVNPDCGEVDKMEECRLADKKASVLMFTGDSLAFTPNPPQIYCTIDFEGGGRYWFDMTDADLDDVSVGMSVEMSFRRKYLDESFGIHGYYWKAIPSTE